MNILCLDDESLALNNLISKLSEIYSKENIKAFSWPDDALEFVNDNQVEIAFLDIEMGTTNGIEVAKKIKKIQPNCNIVFSTGYDSFMANAFELGASDYLTKPITKEKIERALKNLRNPISFTIPDKGLYVKCFGEFEIYYDGKPLATLSKKEKELFAFLINKNGVMTTPQEINDNLWEDASDANLRRTRKNMIDIFTELGLENIFIKTWGGIGIIKEKVLCDYFEYQKNNPLYINQYKGEYMSQFIWSKQTELFLEMK